MRRVDPPETDTPFDPTLEAEVERAMEPYRALLPPEMLEVLREALVRGYTEHPAGRRILHHLRPPHLVTESGDVPISKDEPDTFEPAASGILRRRGR